MSTVDFIRYLSTLSNVLSLKNVLRTQATSLRNGRYDFTFRKLKIDFENFDVNTFVSLKSWRNNDYYVRLQNVFILYLNITELPYDINSMSIIQDLEVNSIILIF